MDRPQPKPPSSPPSGSNLRPLVGQLRVARDGDHPGFADDTGRRAVMLTHWFPALHMLKFHPTEAFAALDAIASAGWHGFRFLTVVGYHDSFWRDREVAPVTFRTREGREIGRWADYDLVLEELLREAKARGLKVHISAGDLQGVFPSDDGNRADRGALLAHCERVAGIVNRVGRDVVALYEVCNESWQNGVPDVEVAREVAARFRQHCPGVLTALSDSGEGEEPSGYRTWADGADVATIHGNRERESAARRAFNLIYEREGFDKPFWQGEPTGPDGSHPRPGVYMPIEDPDVLFAIYAVHLMTGQGSVFINAPGLRHFAPLDSTWGFRELPEILTEIIPDDIGAWRVVHGNRGDAPISAPVFADRGTGPARVDQAFSDRRIVCVVHGGSGAWNLFTRRPMRWKVYRADGLQAEGEGPLPAMDASMKTRVIVGEFR